ncbi:MAG: cation diffusion facilitator family transporter [Clostridia bacterium]|nr:cation diffusion facilitator family transporter [Clostridia bacterium]
MNTEDTDEAFDFDELEAKLEEELEIQFEELDLLKEEKEKIGSPDALGETIKGIVWEQFINQVAVTAGKDFIKENNGLHLDLSDKAHIQTAENFAEGKIATHNHISREKLEQNYDRYKNTPHKDFREKYVDPGMNSTLKRAGDLHKQGVENVTDIYTGKKIPTATKLENGKNNPKAAQREHVKPSAKLYEDPSLQMANSNEELAGIINNPDNLQGYTTAERNNRKSDNLPDEMNEKDKTEHWKKANKKAEDYIEQEKKKGEERLKKEGRKTQKEEAFRIGGKALRAVLMQMLAELVKEIIGKLVKWFKEAQKNLQTLLESIKEAILSFVSNLKTHLVNAGNTVVTTIVTAIIGPVFGLIKKVWTMLKQGWKALKDAVAFIRDPNNKNMPIDIKLMEVGKIVIAGLTGIGAMALGELIEKGLMALPGIGAVFAFEIPLLGSLASLLGIFLGAVVAGIIGAIAINLIQKKIEKKQKARITDEQLATGNKIINTQHQIQIINEAKLEHDKNQAVTNISERHEEAKDIIQGTLENIAANCADDESTSDMQEEVSSGLDELLGGML